MNIKVRKRSMLLPVLIMSLVIFLSIGSFAVKCFTCGSNSAVATCTGQDVSYNASHLKWGYGWCTYYVPSHWVNTSCCERDLGSHQYDDTLHPCGQYDVAFPCSLVYTWDF